jgi:hypothetical protein
MAAAAVTFDGVRVNDADSSTDWGHWGGGGPAPASEPQLRYQYSGTGSVGAVNKKATGTGTTYNGIDYDPGAAPEDMETVPQLWFLKTYVSDFSDLNAAYGVRASLGSALGDRYEWDMAGTDENSNTGVFAAYPAQGGYLIASIDPNVAAWREGTTGSPDLAAVDWFGVQVLFINGGAKDVNFAIDALDVGTGLTLKGGDGASTEGTWEDFRATDEDTEGNRWGVVVAGPTVRGLLIVGTSAEATEFIGTAADVLTYPDGYHSEGMVGALVSLEHVDSIFTDAATHIGKGSAGTEDTRPNYTFVGTTSTAIATFAGNLQNFKDLVLTSKADLNGAVVEVELLTQASGEIQNSVIRTNSLTSVACLQDPTFGVTTGLHDTDFIQTGAGHALELDTAGTYVFTNLTFTGYGADTTDDAAVDVTETSGTVTIQYTGSAPTYKTAGATVVLENTVNTTIKAVPVGAEYRLYVDDPTQGTIGSVELQGAESWVGGDIIYADNYSSDTDVVLQVLVTGFEEYLNYFILGDSPQTVNVEITLDTNI